MERSIIREMNLRKRRGGCERHFHDFDDGRVLFFRIYIWKGVLFFLDVFSSSRGGFKV